MSGTRRAITAVSFPQVLRQLFMERAGTTPRTSERIGMAPRIPTELASQLPGASAKVGASRSVSATATAMDIRITRIHGGDRGDITAAAAGLRRGATDGEDTRARTFTDAGEMLR